MFIVLFCRKNGLALEQGNEKTFQGWALQHNGKYWGLLYADGQSTQYGWTDDIDEIEISERDEKPPTKSWFTYLGSHYIPEMEKGEWVVVEITKGLKVVK